MKPGKEFYHKLGFIYIQLAAFEKAKEDVKTGLEQWLFIIKHLSKFVDIPSFITKPIFKRLFKIAEVAALTKEERMAYETSLKDKWDRQNQLDFAVEKAVEEERAKAALEIENIARNFKALNIPIADIAKATGMSIEEIERL